MITQTPSGKRKTILRRHIRWCCRQWLCKHFPELLGRQTLKFLLQHRVMYRKFEDEVFTLFLQPTPSDEEDLDPNKLKELQKTVALSANPERRRGHLYSIEDKTVELESL